MTIVNAHNPDELSPPGRHAREIVEGVGDGFLSMDTDWRITDCNAGAERLLRRQRNDLLGLKVWSIAGLAKDSAFAGVGRRVARSGRPEEAEFTFRANRRARLLLVRAFPLAGGVGVVWRDITRVRAAERRLAATKAHHREVADDVPAAAWLSRADGQLIFVNNAMARSLGRPSRDLLGDGWMLSIDPDDRASLEIARAHARSNAAPVQYEGKFRRPDGSLRIIQLYGRPRFDRAGVFCGHVGIATDVTEVREAEARQRLLINELNHRVKNALATVQFLVSQTLREHDAPRELGVAINGRIFALAAAHDVLTREKWVGADLGAIAAQATKPFSGDGAFSFSGPKLKVAPKPAVALSIALHELATNSLKYGSLSCPTGRISMAWNRAGETFALEWRESGGPPVTAPEHLGFGARLLGPMLQGDLGAPAEMDYRPDGLVCHIRGPVETA
jgi:PAS domain S-box-containing protein